MSVHHPMTGMSFSTQIYSHIIKLEACSMATRGSFTAALNTVSLSEAFSGVRGDVVRGPQTADRAISPPKAVMVSCNVTILGISCQKVCSLGR